MAGARAWHQLAGQRRASSSVGRGCGTSIQARNAQMLPSQAQALQSGGQSLRQRFASSSWTRQRFASSSWTRCWSSTKAVLPPHQHGGAAPHQHGGAAPHQHGGAAPHQHGGAAPHQHGGAAPHQHGGAAPHQHGGAPFAPRVNFPSCARYGRHQSIPLKQLELHPGAGASAYTHTHTAAAAPQRCLLPTGTALCPSPPRSMLTAMEEVPCKGGQPPHCTYHCPNYTAPTTAPTCMSFATCRASALVL